MSILVAIPVIKSSAIFRECLSQLVNKPDVTVLVLLNGADEDVRHLVKVEYADNPSIIVWENEVNEYVTKPWNRFIEYFLSRGEWDHLIILNSDLTMCSRWNDICNSIWQFSPDAVLVPTTTDDKNLCFRDDVEDRGYKEHLFGAFGIPGIFITLNKKQAKFVYPIPSEIKVWFNDEWIYQLLGAAGYPIYTVKSLWAYHHHSVSVGAVTGIHAIIEEDKIAWRDTGRPKLIARIEEIQQNKEDAGKI